MHSKQKTHQTQIMITMQMAYKNVIYSAMSHFELCHPDLSALSAINQIQIIVMIDNL
jgi:hypothetical protein